MGKRCSVLRATASFPMFYGSFDVSKKKNTIKSESPSFQLCFAAYFALLKYNDRSPQTYYNSTLPSPFPDPIIADLLF
jgi:hypothetical protein